ncbi:hypothetical protein H0H81_012581 [Sphagnurus paluster]|uniref:AMP-dependent synthetase/ligase domain-containing protein n=1 Tax=Sphagnurus paluster TaxID=117069 RepID=A0A9P7GPA4_9AGAR|nr:hypothetical protein H0H81_012581 [Sphagnurus paluster]
MAPRIYTSPVAPVRIVATSVFSHLFAGDEHSVGGFPADSPAYVDADSGTTLTRAQTKQQALSLAHALKHDPRIRARRGDVALVFSHNSLSWPVVLFGSVAAGLRCTLANSAYTPKELAFQYTDSGARLLFSSEEGLPTVFDMFALLGVPTAEARERIVVMEAALEWAGGPSVPRTAPAIGLKTLADLLDTPGTLDQEERFDGPDAHETVYLCYSSGTTGKPKGVETTHQNITSVLEIVKDTFPTICLGTDKMLGILPFYHIYGAVKLVHFPWTRGVPVIIQPRFDPDKFCASIERYRVTIALIVPPVLVVLARHPAVDKYDVSSLAALFSGAAPLGAALVEQVTARLQARRNGKGGFAILQGYGLTETSPTTHLLPLADAQRKVGSIGILLPNLEARLLVDGEGDGEGDVEAEEGQAGELWIRGPTIMKGYLNNPKATRDSITPDGWFKTGDIAVRDAEGYYAIVDRRKELIKYKVGFVLCYLAFSCFMRSCVRALVDSAARLEIVIDDGGAMGRRVCCLLGATRPNPARVKTEEAKRAFAQEVRQWTQARVARHKFLRGGA